MAKSSRSPRVPWIDQLVAQAYGPVRIHVTPSVGVSLPVEVVGVEGPRFVDSGDLGLPERLEKELVDWLRWWEAHIDGSGRERTGGTHAEWRAWAQEGRRLVIRVQGELGRDFHVTTADVQDVIVKDSASEGLVSITIQLAIISGFGVLQLLGIARNIGEGRWARTAVHAVLLAAMVLGFILTVKRLTRLHD